MVEVVAERVSLTHRVGYHVYHAGHVTLQSLQLSKGGREGGREEGEREEGGEGGEREGSHLFNLFSTARLLPTSFTSRDTCSSSTSLTRVVVLRAISLRSGQAGPAREAAQLITAITTSQPRLLGPGAL